ncbi:hypothetical protein EYZ11_009333 [Aspergillus tanneri]|nr:hypothetical protein EYZ11_009333 [Aspergillus tanneri]
MKPKIMIRLDNGWDLGAQRILSSYSPTLSRRARDAVGAAVQPGPVQSAYSKPLLVVDTNWPESCPNTDTAFPANLRPISFSGQKTLLQQVAAAVEDTTEGVGLYYWKPAWVDNAGLGPSCIDYHSSQVRESVTVFRFI